MAGNERWIVAYDVSADGTRLRVSDALNVHGSRIQRSVFVIDLPSGTIDKVDEQLRRLINHNTDAVHLFRICENCQAEVRQIGQAGLPDDEPCWIVI